MIDPYYVSIGKDPNNPDGEDEDDEEESVFEDRG